MLARGTGALRRTLVIDLGRKKVSRKGAKEKNQRRKGVDAFNSLRLPLGLFAPLREAFCF
jgi:hypothetical protein